MIEYHSKQGKLSRVFSWAIVTILMIGSLELVDQNANFYQTSILQTPKAAPFDGTIAPVANVPDWVSLNDSEQDATYTELQKLNKLIALPYYDAGDIGTPIASLIWGDSAHDKIRNTKITYAVPYMGSYKLDGREYSGSHLAIDIKTATGTPIQAIANGVVMKSVSQSTGFGKHIVIKHVNVPVPENPSSKTTLYSSYSHMSALSVSEGEIVKKGQIIGYSGESGTATTPHLHFQIDKASAPWHPYWPFTWKDAQDNGVNFFEAVNIGLGKDYAIANTVHPMNYVQKYHSAIADTNIEDTKLVKEPEKSETPEKEAAKSDFQVKFTTQKEYKVEDAKIVVIVRLFNEDGDVFEDSFGGVLKFSLKDNESRLDKTALTSTAFVKGKAKLTLTQLLAGQTQIVAEHGDKKFYSPVFEIVGAVDEAEDNVSSSQTVAGFFTDVTSDDESFLAIKYLYDEKVISGYEDGTFKPDKPVTRVEALKFITEALLSSDKKVFDPKELPFKDTTVGVWYSGYVATAYANGLVNGYNDHTFRPAQDVNRAEFAKMALSAIDAKFPSLVNEDPYRDVSRDLWFASIIAYAKDKNFLDEDRSKIYPGEAMTRRDVAEFIFRIKVLQATGALKYDERLHSSVPGLKDQI